MSKNWVTGTIIVVVLMLAATYGVPAYADAPDALTPTATATPGSGEASVPADSDVAATPTQVAAPEEPTHAVEIATVGVTPTLAVEPTVRAEDSAIPVANDVTATPPVNSTVDPTHTPTLSPTPTPSPAPTSTPVPPTPGTAYLAVMAGESVIPVGGTADSEVFVSLRDVQPSVQGLQLHLTFDPAVVLVVDADGNAANGVQITAASFLPGSQKVTENRVDNTSGEIVLALTQSEGASIQHTDAWEKVATIKWTGQKEGNSVIAIAAATQFITSDGQSIPPNAANDGTVFVRMPGRIEGTVVLQGRTDYRDALIASSLASARVDREHADAEGRFVILTSHGEGFYTLRASAPGYLSAESDRPIKLTVGSVAQVGQVTLLGGDTNGDNLIDIRDLSFVAWHFDGHDAAADINGDGRVDILDLSLTAGNFGQTGPTLWPVSGQGE